HKPSFVLTSAHRRLHAAGGSTAYQQYVRHLNRTLPEPDQVERFATGYQDYLQAPLQPLTENLDSSTYETFEKDPVKYAQYEKVGRNRMNEGHLEFEGTDSRDIAVYQALLDRVPAGSEETTVPFFIVPRSSIHARSGSSVIMVVGAGRGPLVNCSLRAAASAERKVRVYAVEKNPNALVTLQNMKAEQWGDQVTVVFTDMRRWKAPEKCDILVSELLGSFGDNELSPECLDGAQKFLKRKSYTYILDRVYHWDADNAGGISIPASYTAYVTPLSSSKLHSEVAAYKDLAHFETPYVVMFQSVAELADPQPLWRFDHPNCREVPDDPDEASMVLSSNLHNVRHTHVTFDSAHAMTVHGVAGYFESVLYDDVIISIHPNTHSPGMFSWFPIFFPLRAPLAVPKGAIVEVDFWRLTDGKKVWYEWCVQTRLEVSEGPEGGKRVVRLTTSPIHNVSGRSSWIG
ncbi:arginine N-methyltransferase 5, partial [Jimgerdemannia flammicorona]